MLAPKKRTITWSKPELLKDYKLAPRGVGIYAIGLQSDLSAPVVASTDYDAYMFNWPENLLPRYIGISESKGEGVRRRIRAHAKCKGNKAIADLVQSGQPLWYVTCIDESAVNLEALFLVAFTKDTGFIANVRSEARNFAKRLHKVIDAELVAKGIDPSDQLWLEDPDYFRDG